MGRSSRRPAEAVSAGRDGAVQDFVLLGRFDHRRAVTEASRAFRAAGFTAEEVLSLAGPRQYPVDLWRSMQGWRSRSLLQTVFGEGEHELCVERLLASGGGVVIVRSPTRFQEACQIIEAAGGRIGIQG